MAKEATKSFSSH